MERAEPHAFGAFADRFHHAALHLARGFVGERQSQNVFAGQLRIRLQQIANPLDDHARLARARARDHQQRPVAMLHRRALTRIQAGVPLRIFVGLHDAQISHDYINRVCCRRTEGEDCVLLALRSLESADSL